MKIQLLTISALVLFVTACGDEQVAIDTVNERVSMATAEEQRAIARENSRFVAKMFQRDNPLYQAFHIVPNGDSTISRRCPQGDGWASLKLISPDMDRIVHLKCSTYSIGIGCLLSDEFKTKGYATQDNICNNDLEYPLPKITE